MTGLAHDVPLMRCVHGCLRDTTRTQRISPERLDLHGAAPRKMWLHCVHQDRLDPITVEWSAIGITQPTTLPQLAWNSQIPASYITGGSLKR